ncbi:regulatory factor X-associated protein [Dryobates pubescens]|uniref:regulatory factor X-associated protein n=1 Tax=Dryobates pubescens TaxID=118200 RepID=UPI0023B8BFA6|nr:regulatory factor X-associated protein [Dryobates pubescens]
MKASGKQGHKCRQRRWRRSQGRCKHRQARDPTSTVSHPGALRSRVRSRDLGLQRWRARPLPPPAASARAWRMRACVEGGGARDEVPGGVHLGGSVTGALRASPAAASSSSSAASSSASSSSPPQLALLVMQPCGGEEVAAAAAAGGVLPLPVADPPLPPSGSGGLMLFYELGGSGDGEAEAGEEAEAAGGESTASPEELEEEEATAAAAAAAASSSGETTPAGGGCKSCTYQGCSETTTQVVKQRKPWMCKRHRNKIYKDKYKRKKNDQALGGGGAAAAGAGPRAEDSVEGSISVTKQRTGSIGDRPARPTLLEQVLNKKRLSLLRSPEVVQFLQKQQQLLSQQALEQRQQQFQGAPG